MDTESIIREVEGMTQEQKDKALVELVRHNTELSMTLQREVGRVRMTMDALIRLADQANQGEDVYADILHLINQYRINPR